MFSLQRVRTGESREDTLAAAPARGESRWRLRCAPADVSVDSPAENPIHCGTLNAYSAGCNYSPPDVPLNGVGWANDASVPGDSGGIAYQGSRAVGIISGNCAGHLAFSWIDVAEQRIAVTTLTFDPS